MSVPDYLRDMAIAENIDPDSNPPITDVRLDNVMNIFHKDCYTERGEKVQKAIQKISDNIDKAVTSGRLDAVKDKDIIGNSMTMDIICAAIEIYAKELVSTDEKEEIDDINESLEIFRAALI